MPALAVQLRMNPKSLPWVAVVGLGAGRLAGWAGVGFGGAVTEGAAGAGCAGLGWGSAVSDSPRRR